MRASVRGDGVREQIGGLEGFWAWFGVGFGCRAGIAPGSARRRLSRLNGSSRRSTSVFAVMVAVLTAATAAGCEPGSSGSGTAAPRLEIAGGSAQHIATSIPLTSTTATVSIGVARVCLSSPGTVSITGIYVTDPGTMAVTNVGIRRTVPTQTSEDLGTSYAPLTQLHFEIGPSLRLTEACTSSSTAGVEVGVELQRRTTAPGRTKTLALDYESGKTHRTLQVPFAIVLCSTRATDVSPCIANPS